MILVVSWALTNIFHEMLEPDQLFLLFAITALAMAGGKGGRRFVTDWSPFVIFIIVYDGLRGVADNAFGVIHIQGPYFLEHKLFGWIAGHEVLPFALQYLKASHANSVIITWLNTMAGFFYTIHFVTPFILGWILWHTCNDRKAFLSFASALTILNVMALTNFFLYPAAPPWYVWRYHFTPPELASWASSAAALVSVDKLLHVPLFQSIYESLNPNAFAAIPSLHGAYPLLIAITAGCRWKNIFFRIALFFYVAATWFSACFLNHHYLIDLSIGTMYVGVALWVNKHFVVPMIINRFIKSDKNQKTFLTTPICNSKQRIVRTTLFISGGIVFITLLIARSRGMW